MASVRRAFSTPRRRAPASKRLGADLRDFIDALGIERPIVAGYDSGGRAACVVAALWPARVRGLVSITGYNIQNIAANNHPGEPAQEFRFWYQWYFHTERGRAGLMQNRRALARLLWQLWSPNWQFDDATFDATAPSFDNADFVDVTIQSYRHRYGNAPGDPALESIERQLAAQPRIIVPTIVLHGDSDGVTPMHESSIVMKGLDPRDVRRIPERKGVRGPGLAATSATPCTSPDRDRRLHRCTS